MKKQIFIQEVLYAAAKLYAHWITINYREAYKIYACNGILFNHESPIRGETFVTKKLLEGLCEIIKNKSKTLYLGNLYAKEIGDMQKIMYMLCGRCYKKKNLKIM